jgi:hypothetical protein
MSKERDKKEMDKFILKIEKTEEMIKKIEDREKEKNEKRKNLKAKGDKRDV